MTVPSLSWSEKALRLLRKIDNFNLPGLTIVDSFRGVLDCLGPFLSGVPKYCNLIFANIVYMTYHYLEESVMAVFTILYSVAYVCMFECSTVTYVTSACEVWVCIRHSVTTTGW